MAPARSYLCVECAEAAGCGSTVGTLLDRFGEQNARATFFLSSRLAESDPSAVCEIHRRGHEVACLDDYLAGPHYAVAAREFRNRVRRARACLEDLTGDRVLGFRAEDSAITAAKLWALDVLASEGFAYDSSIRCGQGGIPGWPGGPARVRTGDGVLIEVPLARSPGLAGRPISELLREEMVCTEIELCGRGFDETPALAQAGLRKRLWMRWFDVRDWA